MSAGDQYNAYRNDVIDSYEKERTTEHRGTKLGDAYDDQTPGIFNNNILITRIELANGLTFKSSFKYTENGTTKTEENFLKVVFEGYGNYSTTNTKPKAIRVWSGNDHWLLTKESACKYLYLIPTEKEVDENTFFDIVYWNGSYSDLKEAISNNTLLQQGHAFLYHDGDTSQSGGSTDQTDVIASETALSGDGLRKETQPQLDTNQPSSIPDSPGENHKEAPMQVDEGNHGESDTNSPSNGGKIVLEQSWENIEDVYLIKAPIHQHFALAPDDRRLPFYGGTYRIVYKNGDTQDIPTFSTLTYAYSIKELRTCQIPTVTNPTDFDWFSHGDEQYRHVPMVITRPSNPESRIRVLDSSDGGVITSIDVLPDIYYIELNSKKICTFQVEDGFSVLEEPTKRELSFNDKVFDISGFKVTYTQKTETTSKIIYYSADAGTLYIQNPNITDDEYTYGSEDSLVSRKVYAKNSEDTTEKLVTTLSYPISEANLVEVMANSGTSVPGDSTNPIVESGDITDDDGALAISKAQKALGANEEQNVEVTSLFSLQYYSRNDPYNGLFSRIKIGIGKWFNRKKQEIAMARERLTADLKQKVRSAALQGLDSVTQRIKTTLTDTTLQSMKIGETVEVKTSIHRYMYSNHIVPPVPQTVKVQYENTLGVIPWPLILKAGKVILPFALRGIKWLVRKIKKRAISRNTPNVAAIAHGFTENGIPFIYEEDSEWRDSPVNGVCADAVITGYDPNTSTSTDTLPVKILSQGQAFNIVLHNPGNFSTMSNDLKANTLIGIRCIRPPISNQLGYGEQIGTSTTGKDVGDWVAVNANNEDVPVTLNLANGGIVCPIVRWGNNISKGTAEQEVKMTINGLQRLKSLGYRVAPHLLAMNNGEEDGIFSGILSIYNRGRLFMESHPRLTELTKRGVAWAAGRLMERAAPVLSDDKSNEDGVLQETDLLSNLPTKNAVSIEGSSDSSIDDDIYTHVVGLEFDGHYPTRKDITLTSLENFFKTSKVCLIYDDDLDAPGALGIGLSRTYLDDGEFVPPTNLARDLLEFGTSTVNVRGMTFSIGTNTQNKDIFNAFHYGSTHQLVLSNSPEKLVYTFGDKRMDFTGATWNIVEKATGKIIINGLTEENLIIEDLPTTIDKCELEVSSREDTKATVRVHFFGFVNDEVKVTLLHPYMVAQEEQNLLGTVSKATAYNLLGVSSNFRAPSAFMCTRVWPRTEGANASWPTSSRDLMINLKTKLVLRDAFMRRKVFNVEDMSQSTFDKIYTISDYNSSTTEAIQQITIHCMGHVAKKWISLEAVGNTDEEDDLDTTSSEPKTITDDQVHTETPTEEWDGTDPDGTSFANANGSGVNFEEDTTNTIMQTCRRILSERGGVPRGDSLQATVIPTDSLFKHGKTGMESVFSDTIVSYYLQSTSVNGFFKKLWKKIKKGARWVYNNVVKPVGKFVGGVVKTVAETAVSVVGGAIGSLTGGAMGSSDSGEYTGDPTQAIYFKPSELLGANGELLLTPIVSTNGVNGFTGKVLPWRSCILKPYYSSTSKKNKLTRVWTSLRRNIGGFISRNASTVPGITSVVTSRRITSGSDPFPAKLFSGLKGDGLTDDPAVFFDAIEVMGINTFDDKTELLTNTSSISNMTFYMYSFCMSSADLTVGDTWPLEEELLQITTLYAQRNSDKKWVAIPFNNSGIKISNYSSTDDATEQLVTITVTTNAYTYTTYAIFHRNSSNMKITTGSDQCYVWIFPHPYASGGSYIAYLGERRHNGSTRTSETQYTDFNYKNADTVKFVSAENRRILSIQDYEDGAESMFWNKSKSENNTIYGNFRLASLDQSSAYEYMLYSFTYVESGDYTEVKLYDESTDTYISKDGILYKYSMDEGGMIIVGYDSETTSTSATIQNVVVIVDEFSE